MEKEKNLVEKYTTEEGFRLWDCILELEARQKNGYVLMEEIKEVLTGFSEWARKVDERLQKLDPKIEVISELEGKKILKGI